MSSVKFHMEKHEKASSQITTAQFEEGNIRGMFYAESAHRLFIKWPKKC